LGVNLPWTLSCVRNYIVVPTTRQTRLFVIIYDTLVTKPFFRNHVVLMVFSVLGFNNSPYFTLMLLDIMNNSSVLGDIIKSITVPAFQLALVFYLFIVTVIIYAQFGLEFFEDWFVYDGDADDGEARGCHSVVSCFWLILYKGVPAGELGDVLDVIDNRNDKFLQRVLFDMTFFVWVGILLFNIITGLMVDTFSALREEAERREDTLANECFVCGFKRTTYDDAGLIHGPSFDTHRDEEHDSWNYVFYFAYLRRKDPTEYNGVESYVWTKIRDGDLTWLPVRTSFAIQNQGILVKGDDDDGSGKLTDDVGAIREDMKAFDRRMEGLEANLKKLLEQQL